MRFATKRKKNRGNFIFFSLNRFIKRQLMFIGPSTRHLVLHTGEGGGGQGKLGKGFHHNTFCLLKFN